MAETLRELVVALSLDSSNFSRNMRTINAQIKEAESTFRLAGAGVQNYEKTIAGTEAKLSMLGQKLTQQQRAVEQYSRALVAANDKLKENYDRHQDYTQRLEQAKARQEDLRFEVEAATYAYENYRDSLGETDSATIAAKQNLERYQEEYANATAEVTKLEGQVKPCRKPCCRKQARPAPLAFGGPQAPLRDASKGRGPSIFIPQAATCASPRSG